MNPTVSTSSSITGDCSLDGAALNLSFNASEIVDHLRNELEGRLTKKGITVCWENNSPAPQLKIQVVQVDEGNQFVRWLIPFIAPAVLEVKGEVSVNGARVRAFHHIQRAQIGLLGGSARHMLEVCSGRLARNIAREVLATGT